MKIGALYEIKKWFWILYPSKDIPAAQSLPIARTADDPAAETAYWSKRLNCKVSFIPQDSLFVLLEQDGKYCKVLSTEGNIGWIIYPENEHWAKGWIEEVKQ